MNWNGFDVDDFTFTDGIGQAGPGYNPPAEYHDPNIYFTVLLTAPHYFNAASAISGNGLQVYSGYILYYQDHGANTE